MSCSRTQRSDAGEAQTLGLESSTEPLRSHCILSNGEVIKYIFISVVVIKLSVRCLNTGPGDKLWRCLKNSTMNTIMPQIIQACSVADDKWARAWNLLVLIALYLLGNFAL